MFDRSRYKYKDDVEWVDPPSLPSSPGKEGQMAEDGTYLYICVADDDWERVQFDAWSVSLEDGNPYFGWLFYFTYKS